MDLQTLQASIDAISSDVNTMKWIMGFIGALIVFVLGVLYRLNERVVNLEGRFDRFERYAPLTQGTSPLTLTERGKKLLHESGGKAYLDKYFDTFYNYFNELNDNWYIQDKAFELIQSKRHDKDDKSFDIIRNYLYNKGYKFDEIVEVMGIELRDRVLNKKGIPITKPEHTAVVRDKNKR